MMIHLLLASSSKFRQNLLYQALIPYIVIPQSADETIYDPALPYQAIVEQIARSKMEHAQMPHGQEGEIRFVLTADTMCVDYQGKVQGKPIDYDDALRMLKLWRSGCTVVTAFCLDKKQYHNNQWKTISRIERAVSTYIDISIPDSRLESYLKNTPISLQAAGAVAIEEFGSQFVKSIQGSYSNIMGLPMYELHEALETLGFVN